MSYRENNSPPPSFFDDHGDHDDADPGPEDNMEAPWEEDDEEDSVVMSVVTDGPRICFAAYNEDSREVWLEESLANAYEVAIVVERVKLQLKPTLILVSRKIVANENLLSLLTTISPGIVEDEAAVDNDASNLDGNNDANGVPGAASLSAPQRSIPYQALRSSAFDVRICKSLILQKLLVESITSRHHAGRNAWHNPARHFRGAAPASSSFAVSRYHALAALVDLESDVQLQALGSLVSYLDRTLFSTSEGGFVVVKDIVRGNFSLYMNVPPATLSALHIFATERHPLLAAKGTGNAKEGFSLFSLMDKTKSKGGRQRLREWMLKPLLDVDAIRHRQNGVELFLLPDFQDALGTILKLLERVGSVDMIIRRLEKCVTQTQDFSILVKSIKAALQICGMLQQDILWALQNSAPDAEADSYIAVVQGLLQSCSPAPLQELSERLTAAIDETATSEWGSSIVIREGYSEELDLLRDKYHQLTEIMDEVSFDLSQQIPHLSEFLDVAFFPQVGFLVRLHDDDRWAADGALPGDFEFIYAEGGITCFKNSTARSLDMEYGDLDALIKDKESLIVAQLEDEILRYTNDLQQTFSALADLDCILSFARLAADSGYVRPNIVPSEENCLYIKKGRHPLQEMILGKEFVPNDTVIDNENRVNIVTGPNFSGKSCYARQVGVLVYMAHTGCFLPCDVAQISVVHEILVRFSAVETCAVPQSTFQVDLSQMGSILRLAGPGSLVLIDEFGKGTSPASGIALLASAIRSLMQSQAKVVCTTHFIEMFSMKMLQDGENGLKALQMAVQVPERPSELAIPLFKLESGVADSSAGLVCARMAGLPQGIVDRAREVIQLIRDGRQIYPLEEIFRANSPFTRAQLELLSHLVQRDWNQATDAQIQAFLDQIHASCSVE